MIVRNKKYNNYINNIYNTLNANQSEVLFRKPLGNKQITIEREERDDKPQVEFKLNNNDALNKNPLIEENEELNKQLDTVYKENEKINDEIKK